MLGEQQMNGVKKKHDLQRTHRKWRKERIVAEKCRKYLNVKTLKLYIHHDNVFLPNVNRKSVIFIHLYL